MGGAKVWIAVGKGALFAGRRAGLPGGSKVRVVPEGPRIEAAFAGILVGARPLGGALSCPAALNPLHEWEEGSDLIVRG